MNVSLRVKCQNVAKNFSQNQSGESHDVPYGQTDVHKGEGQT